MNPDLQSLLKACAAFTGPLEGNVLWPYRDSAKAGNATVGRGHLLYSAAYAANVFGVPLNILQPQWDDLMKSEAGRVASFYETVTDLRITPAKSDELFQSDLWQHILRCRDSVTGFVDLPEPAQVTIIDIDFNVGNALKFPAMLRAAAAKDWPAFARESNRPQLPARSKAVLALLEPFLRSAPVVVI